jgi:hypothetical protein
MEMARSWPGLRPEGRWKGADKVSGTDKSSLTQKAVDVILVFYAGRADRLFRVLCLKREMHFWSLIFSDAGATACTVLRTDMRLSHTHAPTIQLSWLSGTI